LVFWVAMPLWEEIKALRQEQAQVSSTLASLRDLQKLRDELLATLNSIPKEKIDRLAEMIPPASDKETLLVNFERAAAANNMVLKKIDFSEDQSRVTPRVLAGPREPAVPSLKYGFSVSGTYESLRFLIKALERNLRIIDVTSIGFASVIGQAPNVSFTARSYYQPILTPTAEQSSQ